MALYRRNNIYTQCSIQLMILLPGNRFLLVKNGPYALWELTFNVWVDNFNTPPGVMVRKELQQLLGLSPAAHEYTLTPMPNVTSTIDIDDKEIKTYLVTIREMFSFTTTARREFKTKTLDEVVNTILCGGTGIFTNNTMVVLRNLGDSDLIWEKKLTNIWGKKSSLQV